VAATDPLVLPPDPDELPGPVVEWIEAQHDEPLPRPVVDPRWGPRLARWRARVERRRAEVEAQYQAEVAALHLWRERRLDVLDLEARRVDEFLADLLWLARSQDPRRKTIDLPHGVTVRARAQQPEWIRDDAELLRWAVANAPEYVESVPRLRWAQLKAAARVLPDRRAALDRTGEVLPTVEVVERPEHVVVSVKLERDADG
jgi:hypothetical protein